MFTCCSIIIRFYKSVKGGKKKRGTLRHYYPILSRIQDIIQGCNTIISWVKCRNTPKIQSIKQNFKEKI